ncbi:MAG TPA: hypothetical protein PL151_13290 [Phycisphaerae bacterium]|nr:hypothetical protein [Phycisphaerae bacterium]HOJ74099.1 hypothetical protein [Phycisphaerae bacterium]HOM50693.1 hypothetical protein [Phycisphaerae bacterium]HON67877.1 hypothetical protein [Phycisphaerae bacterium]HOQ85115.1 hypothetical protein [Phycisphaerae bacterium]
MYDGIDCPRCARRNPGRAKFCANCGLSFLSAGVIPDTRREPAKGGGLVGVLAGFVLVFVLVALLSFVRAVLPGPGDFRGRCLLPVEQEQVRVLPGERNRLLHHDADWIVEPPRTVTHLHRPW